MSSQADAVRGRHPATAAVIAAGWLAVAGTACGDSDGPAPTPAVSGLPSAEVRLVERVVDGDTLIIDGGERVRLIGIDTPETKAEDRPVECFGPEASDRLGALLPGGAKVRLVLDVEPEDRFGRTLAYVYRRSDGLFVNGALVEGGYARAGSYRPNVAKDEELVELERRAREARAGLWGACPP